MRRAKLKESLRPYACHPSLSNYFFSRPAYTAGLGWLTLWRPSESLFRPLAPQDRPTRLMKAMYSPWRTYAQVTKILLATASHPGRQSLAVGSRMPEQFQPLIHASFTISMNGYSFDYRYTIGACCNHFFGILQIYAANGNQRIFESSAPAPQGSQTVRQGIDPF